MCQTTFRQCAGTHDEYDLRYISCTQTTATIDSTRRTRGIFSARKCSTSLKLKSFSLEHSTSWVLRHWRRRRKTLTYLCVVSTSFACAKHHLTCITYAHIYSEVLLRKNGIGLNSRNSRNAIRCAKICHSGADASELNEKSKYHKNRKERERERSATRNDYINCITHFFFLFRHRSEVSEQRPAINEKNNVDRDKFRIRRNKCVFPFMHSDTNTITHRATILKSSRSLAVRCQFPCAMQITEFYWPQNIFMHFPLILRWQS